MKTTRLLFVGGFLGAGKTTLLAHASQRLTHVGHTVGMITNDQAPALVDTIFLSQNEKEVAEVSGSCFCCNFAGLVDAVHELQSKNQPSIILAEPVGSCTDLSATIFQPLKEQLNSRFSLSPLSVLIDVKRLGALAQNIPTGLHPDAQYILCKQLEEADVIVVNKVDQIGNEEKIALQAYLSQTYPQASFFFLSAKTGEGVQEWLDAVLAQNESGLHIVEVDYDRYAVGEAILGWLNGTLALKGEPTEWKSFAGEFLAELGRQLDQQEIAVGHIKCILASQDHAPIIANLTGTVDTLDVRGENIQSAEVALTINARAEMPPQQLEDLVQQVLSALCGAKLSQTVLSWQSLSPGRPNPTHRYSQIVELSA